MYKIKKSVLFKIFFFIITILLTAITVHAHNISSIKGTIKDSINGEPIPFVNIIIENTLLGTSSDINGQFEFKNIHEGTYNIITSHVGYQSQRLEVKITAKKNLSLEITLASATLETVEITAERKYSAVALKEIRNLDLDIRPNRSSQDLLQLVPGLVIAQHAGGGKAEQIYIRGFDCDHGTDVSISVDGIPVNMVSHGHGQGYADLHFLIPELIEELDVYKGPYFANLGNFATGGGVEFKTKDILEDNLIKIEGGEFNTAKYTMLYQLAEGGDEQNAYIGTQYYRTNGPFSSPQGLQRFNVFGKYFTQLSHNSKITFSFSSFSSAWDASGQIPDRAVKKDLISRFDGIDNIEGGTTGRQDINLNYVLKGKSGNDLSIRAYMSKYNFKLFSNFTFFLEDSINGDMIEQIDNRTIYGVTMQRNSMKKLGKILIKTKIGSGYRADDIDVALWKSPNRIRLSSMVNTFNNERNLFMWGKEEFIFGPKLRIQFGLRGDYFTYNVEDFLETENDSAFKCIPHASGYTQQAIVNPKFNIVYEPINNLKLFFNSGSGFHSNDARSIIIQKTATLPRAKGTEIGIQTKIAKKLHLAIATWYLHMEKEFVYVGDGGITELNNPTERKGIDVEARYRIKTWMYADADISISEGIIIGAPNGENHIPLAPNMTSTGGITVIHPKGFEASIRYRHVGSRPANEDNSVIALGYTIINAGIAYKYKDFIINAQIENILDIDWNEAQFETETRLKTELHSISELHYTPGNPRNMRFGISYLF